jgi:hypothetical protein
MSSEYLQKDKEWFERNREELLKHHKSRWIAIHDQESIGIFDSFKEAYNQGVEKAGSEDITVRQITEKDEPIETSINLYLGLLDAPTYS